MRSIIRTVAVGVACFGAASWPLAAFADGHLPIVTISPNTTFADGFDARGNAAAPAVEGVNDITGTVTIPIFKGLSGSYDRIVGGLLDTTISGVSIRGIPYQPGSFRDIVQQFRLDGVVNRRVTLESGLISRHRQCCPSSNDSLTAPASTEEHIGYVGITYTTPAFKKLHYTSLILNVTGRTANHHPSRAALAAEQPGLDIGNKREYGADYVGTLVVPIDLKNHLTATATVATGELDFFENFPFPFYYNIQAFALIKQMSPYLGIQVGHQNLWQARQGAPIPLAGGVIHESEFTAQLDIHLDFNKLVGTRKPAAPGTI